MVAIRITPDRVELPAGAPEVLGRFFEKRCLNAGRAWSSRSREAAMQSGEPSRTIGDPNLLPLVPARNLPGLTGFINLRPRCAGFGGDRPITDWTDQEVLAGVGTEMPPADDARLSQ
jgi:hypothetical protein